MQRNARKGVAPVLGAAVVISLLAGLGGGILVGPSILGSPASVNYNPAQETKEFVVYSNVAEFNESVAGVPHDQFSPSTLVVNQGDKVIIHFYNTESDEESHNLIISAYGVSVTLAQGEHQDITFTATQAGVFRFYCSFHLPTMTGQLVVLPTSH